MGRVLSLVFVVLGCGGAPRVTTRESVEPAARPSVDPVVASVDEAPQGVTGEPADDSRTPREPTPQRELRTWQSEVGGFPCRDALAEPAGAIVRGAGTRVRVRADSLTYEVAPGRMIVCDHADSPEARTVFLHGRDAISLLRSGRVQVVEYDEVADDMIEREARVVLLEGSREVTTVRPVMFCPGTARPCVIGGSHDEVASYADREPGAPRSGWDLTVRSIAPTPARALTLVDSERTCGLEVGFRDLPATGCSGTFAELRRCLFQESEDRAAELEDLLGDTSRSARRRRTQLEAEAARFRMVFSDGTSEVTLPGFEVNGFHCVDGNVLLNASPAGFGSTRSIGAIEVSGGRIQRARRMTIRDHYEAESDCANAWDGVVLVHLLRGAIPIGGIVLGAGGRPVFEYERGDVGDNRVPAVWPGEADGAPTQVVEFFEYGDNEIPLALRETPDALIAVGTDTTTECTLEVGDPDGQTNVRPGPSTRRAPVGTIATGTRITPVEQRGRWYRLESPVAGWVYATSLRRRCGG